MSTYSEITREKDLDRGTREDYERDMRDSIFEELRNAREEQERAIGFLLKAERDLDRLAEEMLVAQGEVVYWRHRVKEAEEMLEVKA